MKEKVKMPLLEDVRVIGHWHDMIAFMISLKFDGAHDKLVELLERGFKNLSCLIDNDGCVTMPMLIE